MTKYHYVHVKGILGLYEFDDPHEGSRFFDGPKSLQAMLTWAGKNGWRLVTANHDFTEFVFERELGLAVDNRMDADTLKREMERGPRALELG